MNATVEEPTTRTVSNVLAAATSRLERAGVAAPRLDAELLLAAAMGRSRTAVFAALREPLDEPTALRFRDLLRRRLRREPLAYVVGEREFWSMSFRVTGDTLIPRPETETLIEAALEAIGAVEAPRILDVGTGSGCLAVALAAERPDASVVAVDVSFAALLVALENSRRNHVEVTFLGADAARPSWRAVFDLVVANPPYIPAADVDTLEPEVRLWEPRGALDGGEDGLEGFRATLSAAGAALRPGGTVLVEIGCDQAAAATALAEAAGFSVLGVRPDLAGLPRVLTARRRSEVRV